MKRNIDVTARANASAVTEVLELAITIFAKAAQKTDGQAFIIEAIDQAKKQVLAHETKQQRNSRTYGYANIIPDLRHHLVAKGIIHTPDSGCAPITDWQSETDPDTVIETIQTAAREIASEVETRTKNATYFEMMSEKERVEYQVMRKATAFLTSQDLDIEVEWHRGDPDDPIDYWGTINGQKWAFEIKALRIDAEGSHRQVGHPKEGKTLQQQLEDLGAPIPMVQDDSNSLQKALDKSVNEARKPAKIEAAGNTPYCLLLHHRQFLNTTAWNQVTMPDLSAFNVVLVLHQDDFTPTQVWDVLRQQDLPKPIHGHSIEQLHHIADGAARTPEEQQQREFAQQAWANTRELGITEEDVAENIKRVRQR